MMAGLLLRFRDLKDRRIVSNHVTLGRWIAGEGFPPGFMLGPNTGFGVKTISMRGLILAQPTTRSYAEPQSAASGRALAS